MKQVLVEFPVNQLEQIRVDRLWPGGQRIQAGNVVFQLNASRKDSGYK